MSNKDKIFLAVLVLMMITGNALCYYINQRPLKLQTNIILGFMIILFGVQKYTKIKK